MLLPKAIQIHYPLVLNAVGRSKPSSIFNRVVGYLKPCQMPNSIMRLFLCPLCTLAHPQSIFRFELCCLLQTRPLTWAGALLTLLTLQHRRSSSLPAIMPYPLLSFAVFLPLLSPPRRAFLGLHASASTAEPTSLSNLASGNRIVQPSSSSSSSSMRSKLASRTHASVSISRPYF